MALAQVLLAEMRFGWGDILWDQILWGGGIPDQVTEGPIGVYRCKLGINMFPACDVDLEFIPSCALAALEFLAIDQSEPGTGGDLWDEGLWDEIIWGGGGPSVPVSGSRSTVKCAMAINALPSCRLVLEPVVVWKLRVAA